MTLVGNIMGFSEIDQHAYTQYLPGVYEAPLPPKRRKKESKSDHADLLARLQRAEDQLRQVTPSGQFDAHFSPSTAASSSVSVRSADPIPGPQPTPKEHKRLGAHGRLIAKGGNTRYLDNNLWVTLDNELQNPQAILQEGRIGAGDTEYVGSDDEGGTDEAAGLLMNTFEISDHGLAELFPTPAQQTVLWQVCLSSCNASVRTDRDFRCISTMSTTCA
jgi:hypothetical protein